MTTINFEQHLEAMIASRETVIKQRERANAEDRDFIRRAKDRLADIRKQDPTLFCDAPKPWVEDDR